jgi:hypothetical protein
MDVRRFHQGQGLRQPHEKAGYMEAILFSYTVILSCKTRWTIYDPIAHDPIAHTFKLPIMMQKNVGYYDVNVV